MMKANLTLALVTSISRVGSAGALRYTERQLYYELCRTLRPLPALPPQRAALALLGGALPALVALRRPRRAGVLLGADALLVAALALLHRLPFTRHPPLPYARFAAALATYRERHGAPPGLITATPAPLLPLEGREPDLADYGLPRLLLCQDAAVAQMLRCNWFHLEASCPVLTIAEALPLRAMLAAMLERTAGARVYLLHDASLPGLALIDQLAELGLPANIRSTALGLRPIHAMRLHLFAATGPPVPGAAELAGLTARERAWLQSGRHAEVQAIRPLRLLRALRRLLLDPPPPLRRWPDLRRARAVGFMTWPDA